ncbi:amidohydrolase family protein [Paraburkholderia sp. Ac-20340]|uniref:amidohydrolase family protein n=1 Tax=Paraburkholderia sp. Ac-20340 TaxID=2703888 RepID=UPI0019815EDC|nr:amidohydrolase family protein [Paraburkholderia sp. Ac-20340]MBN3856715.1 amidohydrolase family protein [Paraburkholderia sp. Ac-20340]
MDKTQSAIYDGPVIDAHHHLWDLSLGRHPWLTSGISAVPRMTSIAQNYGTDEYVRDLRCPQLVGSVYVESLWSGDPLEEIKWVNQLDRTGHEAARIVAAAPLGTEAASGLIREYADHPAIRGVRSILSWHPDPEKAFISNRHLSREHDWRRDVRLLLESDLHLEVMMYPYQAADVHDLAKTFPDLLIVINHCGSPIDRDKDGMLRWKAAMKVLASTGNVFLKISNASIYDRDWDVVSLSDLTKECIRCFGAQRVMFGSDLPVSKLNMETELLFETAGATVGGLSPDDQRSFFYETAKKIYRFNG